MRRKVLFCLMTASIFSMTACHEGYGKKVAGGVEVENERVLSSRVHMPSVIYVADFELSSENYQPDRGVRGALPNIVQNRLPERLGERLPHPLATKDPAGEARELVDELAKAMVADFVDKGMPARRFNQEGWGVPPEGWLVRGVFTEVAEGNRIDRAVIGFGKGGTEMEAQVGVSDLAGPDPLRCFALFGTIKDPNRIPGAVVTRNPYVAAAKFVMEKNAAGRDVKKSARQIVDEILGFRERLNSRGQVLE